MQFVQISLKDGHERIINLNDIIELHTEDVYNEHFIKIENKFNYVAIIRGLGVQILTKEQYFKIREVIKQGV